MIKIDKKLLHDITDEHWDRFVDCLNDYYKNSFKEVSIKNFSKTKCGGLNEAYFKVQYIISENGELTYTKSIRIDLFNVYENLVKDTLLTRVWRRFMLAEFADYRERLSEYRDSKRKEIVSAAENKLRNLDLEFNELI